jgi:Holliday junction resolvase RusA-like endonuclease
MSKPAERRARGGLLEGVQLGGQNDLTCSPQPPEAQRRVTSLVLPWPPALNNLFANVGRRRIRTSRYEAWIAQAGASVARQRPERLAGPFKVELVLLPPDRRVRDLDGLAKAPLDLLVKAGVIEDDHLAREIRIRWADAPPTQPGSVVVHLERVA